MLRKWMLWGACLALLSTPLSVAALQVDQAVITTAVIDREPVDSVEVYPIQDSLLYCFSRVLGADEPTAVTHVWYRGDQMISRVELPVGSPDWRTWSAKRLLEDWQGDWRVDILDAKERLLHSVRFQLR